MNKEQAIAALQVEQREYEPGRDSYEVLNDAIEILCALPDETPTVLTREMIIEVTEREKGRYRPDEDGTCIAHNVYVDGHDHWFEDQSCVVALGALRDALLALGPVVAEGPVQCPTNHMCTLDNQNMIYAVPWRTIIRGQLLKHCPDCGTRLQGGER